MSQLYENDANRALHTCEACGYETDGPGHLHESYGLYVCKPCRTQRKKAAERFTITYTFQDGICATIPPGDELARHAAEAYGHVLNTHNRRHTPHSGKEFADAIAEAYDTNNPQTAAIVKHLRML